MEGFSGFRQIVEAPKHFFSSLLGPFQRRQGLGPRACCLAELLGFFRLRSCRAFLTSQNGIGRLVPEIAQSGTVTNGKESDR